MTSENRAAAETSPLPSPQGEGTAPLDSNEVAALLGEDALPLSPLSVAFSLGGGL